MRRFLLLGVSAVLLLVFAAPAAAKRPPRLLLDTASGTQRALQETFCISYATPEGGVDQCADMLDARPTRFLTVRARETLTFRLRRGVIVREDPRCHPSCGAGIAIYRLGDRGRKHFVRTIDLPASPTQFPAPRRPGRYELEAFVGLFMVDDGREGDTSGSFGIRVSSR